MALLFLITVINFVDRQTLSVVAPVLREQFRLSATEYGVIVSSFMFGMMAGEFPMGWLMDRFGVRTVFSFAAVWWSLAACLHAAARSAFQFCLFRFCLGTGECANFSGGMKVVSEWFPARERALGVGVFNAGSMIGSLIATPLVVFLTLHYGWRIAFLAPGAMGAFWALAWRSAYRPLNSHPRVTAAERAYIVDGSPVVPAPPPNRELLRRIQTWGLMTCRFLVGPVIQFYWFWMPDYLHRARGMTLASIGLFAWLPYLFGDVGSIGGGWASGFLMKKGAALPAARLITLGAGALCCSLSFAVAEASSAAIAIGLICAVVFGHTFLSANMFASISDIFPQGGVGRVTGFTGIAGGASGLLFPLATGWLVDHFSYTPVFLIAAFMPALGVTALALSAGGFRKIEFPEPQQAGQ